MEQVLVQALQAQMVQIQYFQLSHLLAAVAAAEQMMVHQTVTAVPVVQAAAEVEILQVEVVQVILHQ